MEDGFYTDVETETVPKGLNEDIILLISEEEAGSRSGCSSGASRRIACG